MVMLYNSRHSTTTKLKSSMEIVYASNYVSVSAWRHDIACMLLPKPRVMQVTLGMFSLVSEELIHISLIETYAPGIQSIRLGEHVQHLHFLQLLETALSVDSHAVEGWAWF